MLGRSAPTIDNKTTKQDRLYVTLSDSYDTWLIEYEDNFFMNIYIKRPKDFDFTQKQTEEEKEACKSAKFILLNELINTHGLKGIELYTDSKDVLLYPMSRKKRTLQS
jgi:hypothetical protein